MSRNHEWLDLIEVSGPFLALPVLREVFPQGLEELEAVRAKRLRSAYEEWRDAVDSEDSDLGRLHDAWIEEVLRTALEVDDSLLRRGGRIPSALRVELPEHDTAIVPDVALVDPTRSDALLLPVQVFSPDTDLLASMRFGGLACSPADLMATYLRATGSPVGVVTNGERWMVVHAPVGQVSTFASWYARLWGQEPETLRAFVSLLSVRRLFGREQDGLPSLFERSLKHQDEVTDALGEQVRHAVEVLVQALDCADQDRNRELLRDVKPQELYEAGLTVMMRLVFLLAAEERGLLLLGEPRYDSFYAVSTLRMQLRVENDEILERRRSAWSRLLAVFRAVFGGIDHPTLHLPAMGGSLFDPDRFPFLEGRLKGSSWRRHPAAPLPIDDRTVLLLLDSIQTFEGRTLSYRALDVEQIGHVYEGLLERTVTRVQDVTLELDGGAQAKDPRVTLGELESARLDGDDAMVALLVERTRRSEPSIRNTLVRDVEARLAARLLTACRGDVALRDRLEPYAWLLRTDPWGYPLVHPKGAFVVVMGIDRRETGTHYTPKSLTEKVVEETLTPLVYDGPARGAPKESWTLKSPAALLDLKVCDPAMGSGAFLVQACRFLSARLVEAWGISEAVGHVIDTEGRVHGSGADVEPLPNAAEARAQQARTLVAERCIYGVDLNPLAVELAKLSLWLVTLAKGRPFGFLDHNLRCGDSLLGINRLEQLTQLTLDPSATRQGRLFGKEIERVVAEAIELRHKLNEIPIRDISDVEAMATLDADARRKLKAVELLADLFIGVIFAAEGAEIADAQLAVLAAEADRVLNSEAREAEDFAKRAEADLSVDSPSGGSRHPFHWPLEFPEAFQRKTPGFDAVIGNPPFLFGKYVTARHGGAYNRHLARLNAKSTGNTDLSAHFLWRAFTIANSIGTVGMITTSSIAEGDTRVAGLEQIIAEHGKIYQADSKAEWPGTANVYFCKIAIARGLWVGRRTLDGREVEEISSYLTPRDANSQWQPVALASNAKLAFYGAIPNGTGFFLERHEAESILRQRPEMRMVLLPFLIGKDLNSANQAASRYAINFWDWSEERAKKECPELFRIVMERVRPYRQTLSATKPKLARDWWLYEANPRGLHEAIGRGEFFSNGRRGKRLKQVLAIARVSSTAAFVFVPPDQVFDCQLIVIASDDPALFGVLQSSVHLVFAWHYGGKMKSDLRYSPTLCVNTFPFPPPDGMAPLAAVGVRVHDLRQNVLRRRSIGLTGLAKLVNDESIRDADIAELREQLVILDRAVVGAYGWHDLNLDHGFHRVAYLPHGKNLRFTIADAARTEVLRRLSELNRQRHEQEQSRSGLARRRRPGHGGPADETE